MLIQIIDEKPQLDYLNCYTSGLTDNAAFKTNHYESVVYQELYPNIDVRFLTSFENNFKFDFILKSGANTSDIQMDNDGFSET
jgi:hypothetical protein